MKKKSLQNVLGFAFQKYIAKKLTKKTMGRRNRNIKGSLHDEPD